MFRILIVDDHREIRQNIRTLLASREDWSVCGEATDGLQAVEQARILHPDLIVMDVSMPNMNGLDAAKIIQREVGKARLLIISQNDPAVVLRQAREANAHGFVEKSRIPRDLVGAIERMFRRTDAE